MRCVRGAVVWFLRRLSLGIASIENGSLDGCLFALHARLNHDKRLSDRRLR